MPQASDPRQRMRPSKRISSRIFRRCCPGLRPLDGGDATDLLFVSAAADPNHSPLFSDHPYARPEPPLLPLPCKPYGIRTLFYPPPNASKTSKRPNKKPSLLTSTAASALPSRPTPKRSPPKPKTPQKKDHKFTPKDVPASAVVSHVIGPNPSDLPRGVIMSTSGNLHLGDQVTAGSGIEPPCPFIYSLAPPPSSLPLPKFALRPKLACNAVLAATHKSINPSTPESLRRILHLP
ncbi:hypothetical protein MLD38_022193 [Melastoma candidum]|uniref:Uncharacterized protein n=1 Tax=Melastoma candidum TaxID=119954 RepID=A0ACB9QMD2_9MYRT|nr:hypothetical protein MLD38_022193 [Melastoma candidum]